MSERSYFELSAEKNCPACKGEGVVEHTHYDYGTFGPRIGGPPPRTSVEMRLCECVRSRVLTARPGGGAMVETPGRTTIDVTQSFKTWHVYFEPMLDCKKPFDVRRLDPERKPVQVGDTVSFVEVDYTGRETGRTLTCKITYVLVGDNLVLPSGWFVMGWNPTRTGARIEP